MVHLLGKLRRRTLGISLRETTFAYRGFHDGNALVREHLERIGGTFVHGYHQALDDDEPESLAQRLNRIEPELRGFAFEGASMGLTLLDRLTPWKRDRLEAFMDGPASGHLYMVHVGVGWAIARVPWSRRRFEVGIRDLDPLLRWLVLDGFGFHEAYFHWRRYIANREVPETLSPYALRVFDQGLGRGLWFVEGADVDRIPRTIAKFAESRYSDLWSGIGLACAYAGGANVPAVEALRRAAGPYQPQLAQGAAFAAKTRQRAGNQAEHTNLACRIFCGLSAESAAIVTDDALQDLPSDGDKPAYEVWRVRIQSALAGAKSL